MAESTALVLGGGGATGAAWTYGMLAGLHEAGVDLTTADLIVGTSAGAVAGAQLAAGQTPQALYGRQLDGTAPRLDLRITLPQSLRFLAALLSSRDVRTVGRRLGRMALTARTMPEAEAVAALSALAGVWEWPVRPLHLATVDAHTGERRALTSADGADFRHALAASCALPCVLPPVTLDGRRWLDGGVHSTTNADLARGYDRVVILAPVPRAAGPLANAERLAERLRAEGAHVALLFPGRDERRAMGRDALDESRRPAAARAGHRQAAACADTVAAVWAPAPPHRFPGSGSRAV